jgi:hypothetical protein
MTNRNKFDFAIPAQRVHDGVQSVPNNAVTPLDSGVRQHLPQEVRDCSRHKRFLSRFSRGLGVVLKQRVVIDAEAMIESPFRSSNSNTEHSGFQATSASIFMERSALSPKEIPW